MLDDAGYTTGQRADHIGQRLDAAIAEMGIPPVTDAQITATLRSVAQALGTPPTCQHGVPEGVVCLRCSQAKEER
jgi:hypothetical protein